MGELGDALEGAKTSERQDLHKQGFNAVAVLNDDALDNLARTFNRMQRLIDRVCGNPSEVPKEVGTRGEEEKGIAPLSSYLEEAPGLLNQVNGNIVEISNSIRERIEYLESVLF